MKRAAVVGAGVFGLSAGRALVRAGFQTTVFEQFEIGTRLASSSGGSRIFRLSHDEVEDVRLARRAIDAWRSVDPELLIFNGLLEWGDGAQACAEALAACGVDHEWLEPAEAVRRFPEARFDSPVLWQPEAGVIRADRALRQLAAEVEVQAGVRVDDPSALEADVVVVAAGPWLSRFLDFPLSPCFEEVAYFAGVPEDRPSIRQHSERPAYGLVTPGVGYKLALDSPDEEFDPEVPEREVRSVQIDEVVALARSRFPGIDPRPVQTDGCLYTSTPDGHFILDEVDGMIVCGGDCGHGFKFGPLIGELVADLAEGRPLAPETARFRLAGRLAQ
ncbi:MAG TPA: FAD-dependent oxidoreductase [Solirubrobacteraceae bacterium]